MYGLTIVIILIIVGRPQLVDHGGHKGSLLRTQRGKRFDLDCIEKFKLGTP